MDIYEVSLFGWTLDENSPCRKIAVRPEHLQYDDFTEKFDYTTLFYDVFHDADSENVLCLCPPFLNLKEDIVTADFRLSKYNETADKKSFKVFFEFDRCVQVVIQDADQDAEILTIRSNIGSFATRIGKNYKDIFADKRVLLTKQRDNPIEWIEAWIAMHQAMHGINAVLLYDNNSTTYSTQELVQRLATRVNLDVLCLVRTPYRFGVPGDFTKSGHAVPWDSDFLNYFFPMHAHRRFLSQAGLCLWGDVDEILLSEDRQRINFKLNRTPDSALMTAQANILHATGPGSDGKTFTARTDIPEIFKSHFHDVTAGPVFKYAYKPAEITLHDQLAVHYVCRNVGQGPLQKLYEYEDASLAYRHFRSVNTGWKELRSSTAVFDKSIHLFDCGMVKAFAHYAPRAGYEYPLEDILEHARAIGACPRPEGSAPAPSWPAYDCSACPYNAGRTQPE